MQILSMFFCAKAESHIDLIRVLLPESEEWFGSWNTTQKSGTQLPGFRFDFAI